MSKCDAMLRSKLYVTKQIRKIIRYIENHLYMENERLRTLLKPLMWR